MRFYGLVLVPNTDLSEEDACAHAYDLLLPYLRNEKTNTENYEFDWFLQPDDIADEEEEDEDSQWMWPVPEMIDEFDTLEIEAILTPDGTWHEPESFELSDSEAWVTRARQLLEQNRECLALKHVFHM